MHQSAQTLLLPESCWIMSNTTGKLDYKLKFWQHPLLALSVHCPQMVWGCVCGCVYTGIAQNEQISEYANVVHTSSSFRPHTHVCAHTHTQSHTIWGLRTNRAKVDIAKILQSANTCTNCTGHPAFYWARSMTSCILTCIHPTRSHCTISRHPEVKNIFN